MNNQSPLVPQGSMMEQKHSGRARVKLAVYFVLAVHGIGLMALLMQGCRRDETTSQTQAEQTNIVAALPPFDPTNVVQADPVVLAAQNATNVVPQSLTPETQLSPTPAAASEYTIAQGDTYTTIAKKFHVTIRGLSEANPGVQPTRLRPGMKIHIPAAQVAAPTANQAVPVAARDTAGGDLAYEVKSGDTLSKIATAHKTTVRAIRAANKLTTDRITVGQKLKIPAPQPSSTVATATIPSPTPLPAQ